MKKLKTILSLLIVINANAQINLSIAEDYIKGNAITLFSHLTEKGYTQTNETIWESNGGIDSVYEYTHILELDKINIIKNTGFIISPVATDSTDYYLDYIKQLIIYLSEDSELVETIENLNNGAMKIITKNSLVYIIDPRQSLIMMY